VRPERVTPPRCRRATVTRLVRGRGADPVEDRAVTDALAGDVRETGERAVRVWRPPRQVAFGRRDARADGYDEARRRARERGYPPVERESGGRAVAYTGDTVAFVRLTPVADERAGIGERYERATADLRAALASLGVDATEGEPDGAFCPGQHSLSASGKIVGVAQRVREGVALVGGCVLVADHEAIAAVLGPVYDALGVPFDPESVGSVARAGGTGDPGAVGDAVADALAGDAARVETMG